MIIKNEFEEGKFDYSDVFDISATLSSGKKGIIHPYAEFDFYYDENRQEIIREEIEFCIKDYSACFYDEGSCEYYKLSDKEKNEIASVVFNYRLGNLILDVLDTIVKNNINDIMMDSRK